MLSQHIEQSFGVNNEACMRDGSGILFYPPRLVTHMNFGDRIQDRNGGDKKDRTDSPARPSKKAGVVYARIFRAKIFSWSFLDFDGVIGKKLISAKI